MERVFDALENQTVTDDDTDYKRLYLYLFNGITDVIDRNPESVVAEQLKDLQCRAEDMFIDG